MLSKLLYELKIPCSKKSSNFPLQLEKMLHRQQTRRSLVSVVSSSTASRHKKERTVAWISWNTVRWCWSECKWDQRAEGITPQVEVDLLFPAGQGVLATCIFCACSCRSWPSAACPCPPCACAPCAPCACMSRPLAAWATSRTANRRHQRLLLDLTLTTLSSFDFAFLFQVI